MTATAHQGAQPVRGNQKVGSKPVGFLFAIVFTSHSLDKQVSLPVKKYMGRFMKKCEPQIIIGLVPQAEHDDWSRMVHSPESGTARTTSRQLFYEHHDDA